MKYNLFDSLLFAHFDLSPVLCRLVLVRKDAPFLCQARPSMVIHVQALQNLYWLMLSAVKEHFFVTSVTASLRDSTGYSIYC